MLLKIYDLIRRIETEVGNNSEVRLSSRKGAFFIRIDWWDEDFHAMREFSEHDLMRMGEVEDSIIGLFISEAKQSYVTKRKQYNRVKL